MADVQRKRRLMVGPAPDRAVSYEMTAWCAVIEEAKEILVRSGASSSYPCAPCRAGYTSRIDFHDLMAAILGLALYK